MIWMNPWAWLGLLGVALPVLIHLLGRGHATPKKFPTLRFIDASKLLPTHRTRIHDPLLLLIRGLIVVTAAAALAGPLVLTPNRRTSLDRGVARAIVVDTSASMLRLTANGRRAVDVARDSAKLLAASAQTSVIVESATPWSALPSIAAWISAQGRRAETVILSDFHTGGLAREDLAPIPRDAAVTLARIRTRDSVTTAPSNSDRITVLAGADQSAMVAAMRDAVASLGIVRGARDSAQHIVIVFPRAAERSAIVASAKPVKDAWMVAVLQRLADAQLPLGEFVSAAVDGRPSLVLFPRMEPGTIAATQLLAAAGSALNEGPSPLELETSTLGDDSLRAWSRSASIGEPASQHRPVGENGPSDARWLWIVVLMLLGAETLVRRSRADRTPAEVTARAA